MSANLASHEVGQLDLTEFDERVTTIWASAAVVNIVIWGILVVTLGHGLYPWWVWVTFPPGAVLGVLYGFGIGRPPSR